MSGERLVLEDATIETVPLTSGTRALTRIGMTAEKFEQPVCTSILRAVESNHHCPVSAYVPVLFDFKNYFYSKESIFRCAGKKYKKPPDNPLDLD